MKKGRNDRRSFVVIAHQKTDRGSSHPSCAFRALCRWPDSRKDLIRCTVLYISFAPSPSALLFLSLSSLFSSVSLLSFLSSSSFTRVMPTRNSGYVCVCVCVLGITALLRKCGHARSWMCVYLRAHVTSRKQSSLANRTYINRCSTWSQHWLPARYKVLSSKISAY